MEWITPAMGQRKAKRYKERRKNGAKQFRASNTKQYRACYF